MDNLLHYTNEYALWRILKSNTFITGSGINGPSNYDWGINFVGARGKLANHQLSDKNCKLVCEWHGECSELLPWESVKKNRNMLYNYDREDNNDARYLLSVGSEATVTSFLFPDKEKMFESWISYNQGNSRIILKTICLQPLLTKIFRKKLLELMMKENEKFKNLCSERKFKILVKSEREATYNQKDEDVAEF